MISLFSFILLQRGDPARYSSSSDSIMDGVFIWAILIGAVLFMAFVGKILEWSGYSEREKIKEFKRSEENENRIRKQLNEDFIKCKKMESEFRELESKIYKGSRHEDEVLLTNLVEIKKN